MTAEALLALIAASLVSLVLGQIRKIAALLLTPVLHLLVSIGASQAWILHGALLFRIGRIYWAVVISVCHSVLFNGCSEDVESTGKPPFCGFVGTSMRTAALGSRSAAPRCCGKACGHR